jgi:hypothetical protein
MRDERGLYYYPNPANRQVRMYVRAGLGRGQIEFRLWSAVDGALWEQHGWVPYDAVVQAAGLFTHREQFDPRQAYDIAVAHALLTEERT